MAEENSASNQIKTSQVSGIEGAQGQSGDKKEAVVDDLVFLHNVPLVVTAELGRITLKIRDLLSLMKGTVLELDKLAGEPLEIVVNDKLVCRGEVIMINDKYGVRMTDIVSSSENFDYKVKTSGN